MKIHKYPRTDHLQGSRLQPGDEDLEAVPWSEILGRYVVVEEKMDGANAGLSFAADGKLRLQSRGHFLTGGGREKHFNLFKQWANIVADELRPALGSRYLMYGEWLYAKHTIYYDLLPHYFLEFDVLDTETGSFLSTARRREMLQDLPVRSVPVLWEGIIGESTPRAPRAVLPHAERAEYLAQPDDLLRLIGPSLYKSSEWREKLAEAASARGLDAERIHKETDPSDLMEGLYLKVEEEGRVAARYKYVRADFLTAVLDSGTHWLRRPIVPNAVAG